MYESQKVGGSWERVKEGNRRGRRRMGYIVRERYMYLLKEMLVFCCL